MEEEVEAEVAGNAEGLGSGRPGRRAGRAGTNTQSLLLKEMPMKCVSKQGLTTKGII